MRRLCIAIVVVAATAGLLGLFHLRSASAHCDTMGGPVAAAARRALEKGEATPVLKWVKLEDEAEIRAAFQEALAVRRMSPQARELADTYFLETLVRVHRAGEGAPYTGLKQAGAVEPVAAAADRALETGSIDELVRRVTVAAAAGIRERFSRAHEASKHADESVEAGRRFVEAYVEFTHYVERLHRDIAAPAAHAGELEAAPVEHSHGHE